MLCPRKIIAQSAELLKMEEVEIEKIEEDADEIVIHVCLGRKAQACKHCGQPTDRVHDYRVRQVRDLELRGKPLRLMRLLRRRSSMKDIAKDTGTSVSGVHRV